MIPLRGKDDADYTRLNKDERTFVQGKERPDMFLVNGNTLKDKVAREMRLNWKPEWGEAQPRGFMNFPTPSGGKYLFTNYFSHFESEHKVLDKSRVFRWVKKPGTQNHLFDCHVYNNAVRDIFLYQIFKELKIQNGSWSDFVKIVTGQAS